MPRYARLALPIALALSCAAPHRATEAPPADAAGSPVPTDAGAAPPPPPTRPQLDGRAFPDGVFALTYDDGPDVHTIELATYLRAHHAPATFFVVKEWVDGLSSDPGEGSAVFATGHAKLPVLDELVARGHRVANHTAHHVLLGGATEGRVVSELRENQLAIDPYVTSGLRLFRVPGGDWSASASHAVDSDALLRTLVGPIRWDVDRKDWDNSVTCDEPRAADCERGPNGKLRVRARVTADRYLASIDEAKHGILLFHDRVGDVGSTYALDVAKRVIPGLEARGAVLVAPILAFGPMTARPANEKAPSVAIADVDGRARAAFAGSFALGDVNGDGRADACGVTPTGIACALASGSTFRAPAPWSSDFAGADALALADVNGDGRADFCARTDDGAIACGLSTGHAFTRATPWTKASSVARGTAFTVSDVNGDGRADLCVRAPGGVACGLAP